MNLTATNETLELDTASSTALHLLINATEIDKSGASTAILPLSNQFLMNTPGQTTILAAPASNKYRAVQYISVRNVDASLPNTFTIQKDNTSNERTIIKVTLQAQETLEWTPAGGWKRYSANGILYSSPFVKAASSSVLLPPHFATANLTTAKTITSGSTFAVYVGKAPRALTSVQLRCRVSTAMGTITWGEVAIAKGSINVGANPTLTVVGWTDVSATFNSLGQKTTTINVSSGQTVDEGDDLWVLIGNQATTALQVRAQSIADDIQTGLQASLATRPSLNVGNGQAYTIEGATTAAAWVNLVI